MTKNSFQSSGKKTSTVKERKDGQLIVDTATNFAVGIHGATAAAAYKYAKEASGDAAAKLANKIVPGSGTAIEFVLDTGVTIGFNEGLETIKDGEFLEDFAEDAAVTLVSNAAAAAVVGILGMSAAPAILTGLLVSSFMGAMYELTTSGGSIKDRVLGPQSESNLNNNSVSESSREGNLNHNSISGATSDVLDDGSYSDHLNGSGHRQSHHEFDGVGGITFWNSNPERSSDNTNQPRNQPKGPGSSNQATNTDSSNNPTRPGNGAGTPASQTNNSNGGQGQTQNQNMEQGESNTGSSMTTTVDGVPLTHTDKKTGKVTKTRGTATYTRGEQNEDGSYEWTLTVKADVDGEPKEDTHHGTARDDDNDGLPDDGDVDGDGVSNSNDSAPTDASQQTPNPMNDNGNTNDYDGSNDGLRGFRGDIDYGPDGKPGRGYNGEHDELSGLDPRIDYGPDGKPGQGYNGEHDGLIDFNPRIDWDRDHNNDQGYESNPLLERLGKINPRSIKEALKETSIANNGRHAQKMGRMDSEFIFDAKAGLLYHNANGSKKSFGSGGAIAEFEVDQELSILSVDFL